MPAGLFSPPEIRKKHGCSKKHTDSEINHSPVFPPIIDKLSAASESHLPSSPL